MYYMVADHRVGGTIVRRAVRVSASAWLALDIHEAAGQLHIPAKDGTISYIDGMGIKAHALAIRMRRALGARLHRSARSALGLDRDEYARAIRNGEIKRDSIYLY